MNDVPGRIHGVVRRSKGLRQPFSDLTIRNQTGVAVSFYNNGSTVLSQLGVSDFSGEFAACGLPTGSYTVEAGYSSLYAVRASDLAPVAVTAGAATNPVDVGLTAITLNESTCPLSHAGRSGRWSAKRR